MDEAEITQALQADLNFFKVKVQAKHRDDQLHILISRSQTNDVDYTVLFDAVQNTLTQHKLPVEVFTVYGRIFGSKHPEWQRQGSLQQITDAGVAVTSAVQASPPLADLTPALTPTAADYLAEVDDFTSDAVDLPDIYTPGATAKPENANLDIEAIAASAADDVEDSEELWNVETSASDFEIPDLDIEAATSDFEITDADIETVTSDLQADDMWGVRTTTTTPSADDSDDMWNVETTESSFEISDAMDAELERSLADDLEMPDLSSDDTSASIRSDISNLDESDLSGETPSISDDFGLAEYSPDLSVSEEFDMSADSQESSMEADTASSATTEPTARSGGKKAVGAIALAALLAVAGGGGWFVFDKSAQEQKLAEAQAISAKTFDPNQLGKVEALQDAHAQLKKAVTLLGEIPNRPGSPYEQAQSELKALQPKLQAVEAKLNAEKPAIDKLENAKKLAMDASIIVQNPPHKADVWQNAQTKWQEALKLLESIPPSSLAAAEVTQKLELYRSNYAAITAQLQKQKQIDFAASLWPQALGPDLQAEIQQLKARNLPHPQFISGCIEIVSPRLNVGELKQQGFQPDRFSKVFCEYVASTK
ncbi:hypothetical protein [Pseudanabaena sp. PCC 6802]|uniref:hypothetical protein n=1 Tax=Pseudanabaena sp. PCC 6802 TaxID=118173 RepID=UPI00034BBDA2|nr:hypothetical protein [Pseudanabaena sp. PCC 6802]